MFYTAHCIYCETQDPLKIASQVSPYSNVGALMYAFPGLLMIPPCSQWQNQWWSAVLFVQLLYLTGKRRPCELHSTVNSFPSSRFHVRCLKVDDGSLVRTLSSHNLTEYILQ